MCLSMSTSRSTHIASSNPTEARASLSNEKNDRSVLPELDQVTTSTSMHSKKKQGEYLQLECKHSQR